MRRWSVMVATVAMIAGACGGGDPSADNTVQSGTQRSDSGQDAGSDDSGPNGDTATQSGGTGTLDNPTPEAPGPLPADGFRIGNDVWERTIPMTRGQCFVQEGDGAAPFAVWGTLNGDDSMSFAVDDGGSGNPTSEVTSDTMFWVSGQKDGTQLTVEHDAATRSISGEGIFYNLQTDEWAYGSFQFTCTGG